MNPLTKTSAMSVAQDLLQPGTASHHRTLAYKPTEWISTRKYFLIGRGFQLDAISWARTKPEFHVFVLEGFFVGNPE